MSRNLLKAVLLAVLVTAVIGAASGQKGGGGDTGKDIPMIAILSTDPPNKIFGDSSMPYVHQGTRVTQNFVMMGGKDGYFAMTIRAATGRRVNLLFDTFMYPPENPNPGDCIYPYFLSSPAVPVQTESFSMRTVHKCLYSVKEDSEGPYTEFIRSTSTMPQSLLDLRKIPMGETIGVTFEMIKFRAPDFGPTRDYDESMDVYSLGGYPVGAGYVLVTATDWDGNGAMDWIIRTIPGRVKILQFDRATDVLPHGDCFKLLSGWPCEDGSFLMPFEVKIARK
jgi:hypothetical protein